MKHSRPALLLLVAVSALCLLFFLKRDTPEAQLAFSKEDPATETVAHEQQELPTQEFRRSEQPVFEAEPIPIASEIPITNPVEQAPEVIGLSIEGRVIGVEPGGVERRVLDGEIVFSLSSTIDPSRLGADFKGGYWKAWLQTDGSPALLNVRHVKIGGHKLAILGPDRDIEPQEDGLYEIRVQIPQATTLRVLDKQSGEHLAGIQLIAAEYSLRSTLSHPGQDYEDRRVASGLLSPAIIDEYANKLTSTRASGKGQRRALVGVEGYTWSPISIDFQKGGEYTVSLTPAASLLVRVNGVEASANAQLRIRHINRLLASETTLEQDGELPFDGLAPGPYSISAEVGKSYAEAVTLGKVTAELMAGQQTVVDLDLSPAPIVKTATASGTVHLAEYWVDEIKKSIMVTAKLLDIPLGNQEQQVIEWAGEVESQRAGYRTFRWTINETQIGSYRFDLYKLPLNRVVQIPEEGITDLEWTLDPPVELLVRVIDASTNRPITTKRLKWAPHRSQDFDLWHSTIAEADTQRMIHRIQAPKSQIDLKFFDEQYAWQEATVDLRDGTREMTIRLEPVYRVSIELWSEGTLIPFPTRISHTEFKISGPGKVILNRTSDLKRKIKLAGSGTYTIELPKLPGYRQPPPQEIHVPTAELVVHRVELVPE